MYGNPSPRAPRLQPEPAPHQHRPDRADRHAPVSALPGFPCTVALLAILALPAAPTAAPALTNSLQQGDTAPPSNACTAEGFLPVTLPRDPYSDLRRVAQLAGAAPLAPEVLLRPSAERRLLACRTALTDPWLRTTPSQPTRPTLSLLPVTLRGELNTAYPVDRNNGALWAGRGLSTALSAGAELRWGPLSAAIAPQLIYQQNRDFEMVDTTFPGSSPYVYPWHGSTIDWPLRFGPDPFWTTDLGQSYARLDALGFAAGISNENLWWGPARRYPIIMSSVAPGFQHLFLGTSRPLDIAIGRLEAQAIWGRLQESRYFDENSQNDRRLFSGYALDFEPRWTPGLYLGITRVYVATIPPQGLPTNEYFAFLDLPLDKQFGNRPGNGLGSLFARWALPESGFEVYVEWAREDYSVDLAEFLSEPDHSQAYTLGLQKVWTRQNRWIRFGWEQIHLQEAITFRSYRGNVTYYVHGRVRQGYTHRGQLLGAYIGPGSDAQYLVLDIMRPRSTFGFYLERVRRDDDAYYQKRAQNYGFHGHDLELTAGTHGLLHLGPLRLDWRAAYSRRRNRNFLRLDGLNWNFLKESNWTGEVWLAWPAPGTSWPRPRPAP